jgi:hypothetical protein
MGSLVGSAIIGIANYAIYMATIDYMICAYGPYSASATGGNGWARDFLAGVLTLPATPFFQNIGGALHLAYASTILFAISLLLVVSVYVIYWKGPELRKRSPFAQQLSAAREETGGRRVSSLPGMYGSRANSIAQQGIQGGGFEVIDALGQRLKGSLDAKGFAAVPGAAPGPGRVAFGKDPADTWADGSFIGTPEWPVMPPSAGEAPAPLDAAVGEGLPTKNWDVEHVMTAAVDAGAAGLGLPPLATAALPIASGLLSGVIKSGKLPSLPVPTVDEDLLEVSGLLAGEKLS